MRAPLFADVVPALRAWRESDGNSNGGGEGGPSKRRKLAIFSSGSVEAQKLFLAHTGVEGEDDDDDGGHVEGVRKVGVDLTGWFDGHFDTVNAGPKGDKESYEKIATALDVKTPTVLFLSDNVKGMWFYTR